MADDLKAIDVAGDLFTKTYRDTKIVGKHTDKANYETGSCFDMTVTNYDRAGAHHLKQHGDIPKWSGCTLNHIYPTGKKTPADYTRKGDGAKLVATAKVALPPTTLPPSADAYKKRPNPPNSQFRKFYERGDLPVAIEQLQEILYEDPENAEALDELERLYAADKRWDDLVELLEKRIATRSAQVIVNWGELHEIRHLCRQRRQCQTGHPRREGPCRCAIARCKRSG